MDVDHIGRRRRDETANTIHVERVKRVVDVGRIRARGYHVVLDSVNGAGGPAGRMLLEDLGCRVTHLNSEPTGQFAHTPEPIRENLTELSAATVSAGADVGFAQDPDADRLAIVDAQGTYIGEEYTLALAARHAFSTRPGSACANLSTSRMIDALAEAAGNGCSVLRSAVGEANVVDLMRRSDCVIGGEGNGGVIDPRVVFVRDSLTAMALTLQVMVDMDASLADVVATIPRFEMIKQKFECDGARIDRALDAVRTAFAKERLSTVDGVRIDWPEGWVHVRGSNTEPIMRVIGEADDAATAEHLIGRVRTVVDGVV